ncbi:CutA1 divalent ion tolerance protein [Streptomyces hygroscopicus subsp. limoneus]|nr:CutA1 divalent ion tolerance protein [Streptomyces hygroscopicus subsp. limoneus]
MVSQIVIAQTTIDSEDQAMALAKGAVERRLAAGVHIDQVTAVYWWKGGVQNEREWRIQYRTTLERLPDLEAWVAEEHSYDVPEWVTIPITGGSAAYLSWVAEESTAQ